MTRASTFSLGALLRAAFAVLALFIGATQAVADDDDGPNDDSDDLEFALTEEWRPILNLVPGHEIEDIFQAMNRVASHEGRCPVETKDPLLVEPLPDPGDWACLRLINDGAVAAIWRIDYEGTLGAGYHYEISQGTGRRTVLSFPAADLQAATDKVTAGRRLASLPIVLGAGEARDLFVRIDTPQDVLDADPVLRPEIAFDAVLLDRAHGFGALLGASTLLLLLYVAMGQLLQSRPAWRYAVYFAAATLAVAANEGYLNSIVPGNPTLFVGAVDKLLEAAQISAHLFFMAAFVRHGGQGGRLDQGLRALGWVAATGLIAAAAASYLLEGAEGVIRYYDLGFELDPLLENPFGSPPLLAGALISASWYLAILVTAGHLLIRGANGSFLFAIGAVTLVFGLVSTSFADELFENLGDDNLVPQFIMLFDGMLFAAAMVLQTFGLRDERDAAIQQEMQATQEKVRLTESLLQTREDRDRARGLAETHRSRLALTGHDLRQPLTSLHLALSEAEKTSPELGQTLRASLDYLSTVLNATVADTRPDTEAEDDGGYHTHAPETEVVDVEILLSNAVRMFTEEARTKGLTLCHEPTDIAVDTSPVTVIRILSNLVSNAVKYTATGQVTLRATQTEGAVAIEVHDTGPGLKPAEIASIRQRYVRGEGAETVAGDGLGLSSAADFAASLGLRLEIQSTPGTGSCFAITGLEPAP